MAAISSKDITTVTSISTSLWIGQGSKAKPGKIESEIGFYTLPLEWYLRMNILQYASMIESVHTSKTKCCSSDPNLVAIVSMLT